jgi:hypothetical protein
MEQDDATPSRALFVGQVLRSQILLLSASHCHPLKSALLVVVYLFDAVDECAMRKSGS